MKKFLILVALITLLVPSVARAQGNHEYEPLEEKTINYKDWTFNSLKDSKPVNLRSFAEGKKLVLVVYFAPWCPNWRNESPDVAELYDKYKANGLDVIAVSEYGSRADALAYFGASGPPYTVVSESESRDDREKTSHYTYRQASGDLRKWGSPYNIFLEPAKLNKTGDVLTEKAWIVNGELVRADVEKFIRERLGLDKAGASKPLVLKVETNKDKLLQATKPSDPTQCSPATSTSTKKQ
ncbi:MAG TPA: TlpA disulfide reductase family protein [Pyrinomonadaceae bacterium]|nr:TlpA disulfide reductase family protein [Pyrinomonadaceae bacterium]